ncbi:MAG: hypothetical protein EXS13_00290 [Planctomycetes bacterium]|nr:hypothetical protein [Planctomycetota bacterium]
MTAPAPAVGTALRRTPRLRLALFGIVAAVALVALAEGALRLAGIGIESPLVGVATDAGALLIRRPSDPRVDAAMLARAPDRLGCTATKAAGVVRIVIVGESTVAGFPFYGQLSFGRLLELALRRGGAGSIEVVNFGRAADSSDDVREAAIAALALAPDLLIVSSGHNEFQASYVAALRDENWPRWRAKLRQLALVRAGTRRDWRAAAAAEEQPSGPAVADRPFLAASEFERGRARYEANLAEVVNATTSAGVPLVIATQVANVAALPCASSFSVAAPTALRDAYRSELAAIETAPTTADPAELAARSTRVRVLLDRDSGVARAHHLAGQLDAAQGDHACALRHFREAARQDRYPNRGGLFLNGTVASLSRSGAFRVVDVAADFESAMERTPEQELFLDYCHPNLEGVAQMAASYVPVVLELLGTQLRAIDRAAVDATLRSPPNDWLAALDLDRLALAGGLAQAALEMVRRFEAAPTALEALTLAEGGFAQALSIAPGLVDAAIGRVAVLVALGRVDDALRVADNLWRSDPEALQKLRALLPGFPNLAATFTAAGLDWDDGHLVRNP